MTVTTEKTQLRYGVEYDGQMYYDVEMRLMTVADNLAAIEEVGGSSGMKITVSMMAHSIERLGDIPKEKITWEFLANSLADEDFDTLSALQARIKKKRMRSSENSTRTASPSSPLEDTESQKPKSAT